MNFNSIELIALKMLDDISIIGSPVTKHSIIDTALNKINMEANMYKNDLKQRLSADIAHLRSKLINKAKKRGISENFGQAEARSLRDKYSKVLFNVSEQIIDFEEWCENYEGEKL